MGTNGALLNGVSSPDPDPSDDADFIGGAELTEIPWAPKPQLIDSGAETLHTSTTTNGAPTNASDLRTESTSLIDGPNGLGGVETVTVTNGASSSGSASRETHQSTTTTTSDPAPQHGITQGELLRQEQEAGIVPVPVHSPALSSQGSSSSSRVTRSSAAASAAASRAEAESADDTLSTELPVAEEEEVQVGGPEGIGMEDTGPQQQHSSFLQAGLDVEGALGRRGENVLPAEDREGSEETEGTEGTGATQEMDGMGLGGEGWEVVEKGGGKGEEEEKGKEKASSSLLQRLRGGGDGDGVEGDEMNIDAEGEPDEEVVAEGAGAATTTATAL